VAAERGRGFDAGTGWRLGAAVTVVWLYKLLYPSGCPLAAAVVAGEAAYTTK